MAHARQSLACLALVLVAIAVIATGSVIRIDTSNPINNIASDIHFLQQGSGTNQWTDALKNEVIAAFNLLGSTVYVDGTQKQYNFWWASGVNGSQPTAIFPKLAYGYNADNFGIFYCNNPLILPGVAQVCYPGLTAAYRTNAADVSGQFVGYDIYFGAMVGLNSSNYCITPTANCYYFRGAVLEALLWTAGLGGSLPTTAVGNSGIPQRLSSANCPNCISVYDSQLQLSNGTYLFNSNSRPQTAGALAVLYSAITSTSLTVVYTPKSDEPDTTTTVYTQPGVYYPGWTLYTWSTNPLRSSGVGPNPGSYASLTSGPNPIGLVGNTLTTPLTINSLEAYMLRSNGLYSYACGVAASCGSCNAIAGCGWCESSSFCVDIYASQKCPNATEVPNFDQPCNVCTSSAGCNPVGVHPSCYTANCVNNKCNVTITPSVSCIVGGNACNLGQCDTDGYCVVNGLCNDGNACTNDTCSVVMGTPTCSHVPIVTTPSTTCGVCAVAGDCTAPPFPGCVNTTCVSGQCVYTPLTGNTCNTGNSCESNTGTCSSSGACVPHWTYLTNSTGFGCPNVTSLCAQLQCVGTGMSPVCTQVPIPAPSPCYQCNTNTGQFSIATCPAAPAGETAICTVTSGAPACSNVTLGCAVNSDCNSVCGSAPVCTTNVCQEGTCVCAAPLNCPKCFACSLWTNQCEVVAGGFPENQCGTCVAGNPCCRRPDCSGARLVNGLGPFNKREVTRSDFVLSDDDNDIPENMVIENGVQVVCQPGVPNLCQYTFVVYTDDASSVIISDPGLNFVSFDGQRQTARTPPQTIVQQTDDSRGTVYRLTTYCSTNVTWSLFAFNHWLNISSGSAGRQLVDDCGVCNGDNECAYCDNNGDECISCGCSAPLLTCRAQDALACSSSGPCSYPTCNNTLDIADMCIDNYVPEGTLCEHKGHFGICNAEAVCIFNTPWSSASSQPYYYSSVDEPLMNSSATQAGLILLPVAVAIIMGAAFIIMMLINARAEVTLFVHTGNDNWQWITLTPTDRYALAGDTDYSQLAREEYAVVGNATKYEEDF